MLQRYRDLHQFLHEQDQELALAFDDHKRSAALSKIAKIYALGLFTDEEFAGLSDDTRARVATFNSI